MRKLNTTFYESELQVRPDDIDMFQHVHSAKYIDYVLAARYDQMARCYGNPMSDYLDKGLGWVINSCLIHFKRALKIGDTIIVKTRITEAKKFGVRVEFEIINKSTGKLSCDGHFDYTMINLASGRAEVIPDWVMDRYTENDQ